MINDELRKPREYDLVLGGNNPPPTDGLVLGGIEGVKHCLASDDLEVRIAALSNAIKYGETGLNLVVDALQNESEKLQIAAYKILRYRQEKKIKQAILNFNPYRFFECVCEIDTLNNDPGFITFTPDGERLLYCASNSSFVTGENIIRYIEWDSKQIKSLTVKPLKKQYFISTIPGRIASLYIDPETNTLIATGTSKDNFCCNQIEIINLKTGIREEKIDNLDGIIQINTITQKQIIQTLYGHSNGGTARVNIAISQAG